MAIATWSGNKVLEAIGRNISFVVAQSYVSLHTASPGLTGANEVAGGSYIRQSQAFAAAAALSMASNATVTFAAMPTATVTHVGLWDAATVGNFIGYGLLGVSRAFLAGDTATITSGNLTVTAA